MSLEQIIVLALIQGTTEFLPISSSGHLILVPALTGWADQGVVTDMVTNLGTLAAVIIYFWRDVVHMFWGAIDLVRRRTSHNSELVFHIFIGTIPIIVVGLLLKLTHLDDHIRSATLVAINAIVFGILLYAADTYGLLRRTYPLDPNAPNLRKPAYIAYRGMSNALSGLSLTEVPADGRRGDMPNTYWYRFNGARRVDVLWNTDVSNQIVQIPCNCREALVRHWNGRVRFLIFPENGVLNLRLDEQGSPVYVEYDPPAAQNARFFPETGHSLRGSFRSFWEANGGLAGFGYPLTEEIIEPDAGSGRPRVVQYFERARFEYFPEFAGSPYEVQLGLLGVSLLSRFGVEWQAQPKVAGAPPGCQFFPESGHSLCQPFLARWQQLGGLALMGLPITEPFEATRPDTGQKYTVQYFERARFEYHPENAGTPYEVLLGLLGRELITRFDNP